MKNMTTCEVVSGFMDSYEREYREKSALADEALRVYRINFDMKDKIHFEHMHMDALVAHGKIKAAKEILTALTETSDENR